MSIEEFWLGTNNRQSASWTDHRDLPAPEGSTFQGQWQARQRQILEGAGE